MHENVAPLKMGSSKVVYKTIDKPDSSSNMGLNYTLNCCRFRTKFIASDALTQAAVRLDRWLTYLVYSILSNHNNIHEW